MLKVSSLFLSFILLVSAAAISCGGDDSATPDAATGTQDGGSLSDAATGSADAAPVTCSEACNHVDDICPARLPEGTVAGCTTDCEDGNDQEVLDCIVDANDCGEFDVCVTDT